MGNDIMTPITDTPITDTPITDTPITDTLITDTLITDTLITDIRKVKEFSDNNLVHFDILMNLRRDCSYPHQWVLKRYLNIQPGIRMIYVVEKKQSKKTKYLICIQYLPNLIIEEQLLKRIQHEFGFNSKSVYLSFYDNVEYLKCKDNELLLNLKIH